MKYIRLDIWLDAWVRSPGMGRVQNETYSEYCHAAYQIKGTAHDSNMIAII